MRYYLKHYVITLWFSIGMIKGRYIPVSSLCQTSRAAQVAPQRCPILHESKSIIIVACRRATYKALLALGMAHFHRDGGSILP